MCDVPPSVLLGAEDLPLLPWSEQGEELSISQIYKRYNHCCGSRLFIPDTCFSQSPIPDLGSWTPDLGSWTPDLGSWTPDLGSQIPDPTTATKEEGENICWPTFYCSHKCHKLKIILFLNWKRKHIWADLQRILVLFTQKFFTKLSIKWDWDAGAGIQDLGSGIRKNLFRIPDPEVKQAPDLDLQHWVQHQEACADACQGQNIMT